MTNTEHPHAGRDGARDEAFFPVTNAYVDAARHAVDHGQGPAGAREEALASLMRETRTLAATFTGSPVRLVAGAHDRLEQYLTLAPYAEPLAEYRARLLDVIGDLLQLATERMGALRRTRHRELTVTDVAELWGLPGEAAEQLRGDLRVLFGRLDFQDRSDCRVAHRPGDVCAERHAYEFPSETRMLLEASEPTEVTVVCVTQATLRWRGADAEDPQPVFHAGVADLFPSDGRPPVRLLFNPFGTDWGGCMSWGSLDEALRLDDLLRRLRRQGDFRQAAEVAAAAASLLAELEEIMHVAPEALRPRVDATVSALADAVGASRVTWMRPVAGSDLRPDWPGGLLTGEDIFRSGARHYVVRWVRDEIDARSRRRFWVFESDAAGGNRTERSQITAYADRGHRPARTKMRELAAHVLEMCLAG